MFILGITYVLEIIDICKKSCVKKVLCEPSFRKQRPKYRMITCSEEMQALQFVTLSEDAKEMEDSF